MILITSGRKPSKNTRVFCRRLASFIPHSVYLTRGKKSVYGLIDEARKRGLIKIAFVGDRKGNPADIRFLSIGKKDWNWDKESMKINGLSLSREKVKAGDLRVEGNNKGFFTGIFCIDEDEESDFVLKTGKDSFSFEYDGKELLKVKMSILKED